MRHCKYCEHGIFDERWGEWKCKKFELTVYNPEKRANKCEEFKGKSAIVTVQTKGEDL